MASRGAQGRDGGTVEVAHEALFREWTRLEGWLEPERARLEALRSLQVDAADLGSQRAGRGVPQSSGQAARGGGCYRGRRLSQAPGRGGVGLSRGLPRGERLARRRPAHAGVAVGSIAVGALAGWLNEAWSRSA